MLGALLGGAAGTVVGFAVGSLGREEPSCLSSPCEGHSYAKRGAHVGLVIGIPVGAFIGWRGTFRGGSSTHDLRRLRLLRPSGERQRPHGGDRAGEREHRSDDEHVPAETGGEIDNHGKQKPAERSPDGKTR